MILRPTTDRSQRPRRARHGADFDRDYFSARACRRPSCSKRPIALGLTALRAPADRLEQELARIPQVEAHSLLDLYRRAVSTGEITRVEAGRVRAFATGTPLFRRAGLLGDHYFGIALELRVKSGRARPCTEAIDSLVLPVEAPGGTITRVRRVDSPWLNRVARATNRRSDGAASCPCSASFR